MTPCILRRRAASTSTTSASPFLPAFYKHDRSLSLTTENICTLRGLSKVIHFLPICVRRKILKLARPVFGKKKRIGGYVNVCESGR